MPYQGGGGFRRGGGFEKRSFDGPKTKIKCSECGKEDEVPFKPREGSPVYCKACFMKKKGITPREQPKAEDKEEAEVSKKSEEKSKEELEEEDEELEEEDEEY